MEGFPHMNHYNVLHIYILMPQAMKIPDAKAAVEKVLAWFVCHAVVLWFRGSFSRTPFARCQCGISSLTFFWTSVLLRSVS